MRHQLTLASACYVTLVSCSGQNLKSQNVHSTQGAKPAAESKSNAPGGSENILADQAAAGKEIAGSFLTQCEEISNFEIGCNLFQKASNQNVKKYAGSYNQKLTINVGKPESINADSKRVSGPYQNYQKVFVLNATQIQTLKSSYQNTDAVSSEVNGVGNVDFRTVVVLSPVVPAGGSVSPFPAIEPLLMKPGKHKESATDLVSTKFKVDPSNLCIDSTGLQFSATSVEFSLTLKNKIPDLKIQLNTFESKEPDKNDSRFDEETKNYKAVFKVEKLEKLDTVQFTGNGLAAGYQLKMISTDVYSSNCEFKKQTFDSTNPFSIVEMVIAKNKRDNVRHILQAMN